MNNERFEGEVVFFSPKLGFGFLAWEKDGIKQKDMFCHFSDISCEGYKTLYKNQKVSFNLGLNKHGVDKAINVIIIK